MQFALTLFKKEVYCHSKRKQTIPLGTYSQKILSKFLSFLFFNYNKYIKKYHFYETKIMLFLQHVLCTENAKIDDKLLSKFSEYGAVLGTEFWAESN